MKIQQMLFILLSRVQEFLTYLYFRADVENPEFSLQFGLLLELYCVGAVEHIDILLKQVGVWILVIFTQELA